MRERLLQFQDRMNNVLREHQRLCFMTRAKELQVSACKELTALKAEAGGVKKEAVEIGDEDAANALLAFENVVQTVLSELEMWIALKEDNPDKAWHSLIDSQMAALHAVRAHPIAHHMTEYLTRLEAVERLLFPPQVFVSLGMIFGDAECSICGRRYGDCEHIIGRPYMGEFCGRIIKDVTFTEVSLVDDPVDKHCIVQTFSRNGKTWVDRMTLRPLPPE